MFAGGWGVAGREPIEVFVSDFIGALERLEERKPPVTRAPLNELRERAESPGAASIGISMVVRKLVEAGYNVEDIRDFFLDAGIVRDMDEWVRVKMDVERAIVTVKLEEMAGGEARGRSLQIQRG